MPRKKVKPKVSYKQVDNSFQAAVNSAFDYLFDKIVEQSSKKHKPAK